MKLTFTCAAKESEFSPIRSFRMAEAAAAPVTATESNGAVNGSALQLDESLLELTPEEMVQKLERDMQVCIEEDLVNL